MFLERTQMRWQFSRTAVSSLVFLLAIATGAPDASAQAGLDVFVTPIPNAPFSGVIHVQRSIVQPDGSIADLKTMRAIGRDSQGRIYNESRRLLLDSNTEAPQVARILLYDPQTRVSTMLYPQERTFSTSTVDRPPATAPPALLYASPAGISLPRNEFTKEEDLGIHELEGLPAHGVREIQTIPADNSGTGKEITISDEYWYSDDLRINLVIKHSDPRTGTVTMTVAQVKRTEPDPALFEIPHDYRPVGARQGTTNRLRR
jgi:hypothetical protein